MDGDVTRAAVVEHDRWDGVLALVRTVLESANHETVSELAPPLLDALIRALERQ